MNQGLKTFMAFAVIYFVWGTTYLAILFVITDIPPLLMSGLRFLLAGSILYAFCLFKKERQPDLSSLVKNMICGILMLVGGTVSVTWVEQYLPSSTTAIIVTSVPFWFVLLDKKHWADNFSNKVLIIGLITGFIGVALLINFSHSEPDNVVAPAKAIIATMVLIVGGISWTSGSLFSKYKPAGNSVLMNSAVQLLVAGFFCLVLSIFSGESENFHFQQVHLKAWLNFGYLVTFGSILTYICYLWLLKIRPAAQVSSYVYVNPVVAILAGAVIGKESITWLHILSLGVILAGVLLINLPKYFELRSQKVKMNYKKCCA